MLKKEYAISEIDTIAKWLLEQLGERRVIALQGDMGAGKTTLINAICRQLGVTDVTSSPTFSIINEYHNAAGTCFFHIDLYRLKDEAEAIRTGVEDCIYSGDYCFVEWPERATGLFPPETVRLKLHHLDDTHRTLEID